MDRVVRLREWEQKRDQPWKLIERPIQNIDRVWVVQEDATGRVERIRELEDMLNLVDPPASIPLTT